MPCSPGSLRLRLALDSKNWPTILPARGYEVTEWASGLCASCPMTVAGASCCTVGGRATPAAWNTPPQVPLASSLRRNRFPSCSTSVACNLTRSWSIRIRARVPLAEPVTPAAAPAPGRNRRHAPESSHHGGGRSGACELTIRRRGTGILPSIAVCTEAPPRRHRSRC
jgi:hypothetical protein